jgi:hypothetical protein
MGIGNNHLYTFGTSYSYDGPTYLTGLPLTAISPTMPIGQIYNTSQVTEGPSPTAVFLYYYQNILTLICARYVSRIAYQYFSVYTKLFFG